jgi:hypothetical protein
MARHRTADGRVSIRLDTMVAETSVKEITDLMTAEYLAARQTA